MNVPGNPNKCTFGSVRENSHTDSYMSLQNVGKTLLEDRKRHNRGDHMMANVILRSFSKRTFSKADGVPKWTVRVTSVVPSLPKKIEIYQSLSISTELMTNENIMRLFTCTVLQSRSGKPRSWREFCWFQAAVFSKKEQVRV